MGILNKHIQKKNESIISDCIKEKIAEADCLYNNGDCFGCMKMYREILCSFSDLAFSLPEAYEIIKKLAKISYQIDAKEDAYMYIALLALTERSKANINDYIYNVAQIAYDATDESFAKGLIKASYYSTDGAYFSSLDSKKFLKCVGIEDDRTFEDYSQDY